MSTTQTLPVTEDRNREISNAAWPVVLGSVVLLAAALPLLVIHFHRLLALPHYQFLPLLALGWGSWSSWGSAVAVP